MGARVRGGVGADHAATVVFGILWVLLALEAWDTACGPSPALAAALGILGGARRVRRVEIALAVVWVAVGAVEAIGAASRVVVGLGPWARGLVMIEAPALAVLRVETEVFRLALRVERVDEAAGRQKRRFNKARLHRACT